MTEGSHPSPKSAMKVVMNSKVIMATVEHNLASFEDFLPLLHSLMVSDCFSEVFSQ